jgi:hypothetical protein
LVVDCEWAEPFSENVEDQIAAQRRIDFQLGWYVAIHIINVTWAFLPTLFSFHTSFFPK